MTCTSVDYAQVKVRFSVIDADNVAALACTHVSTFKQFHNHISVEDFISLEKLQVTEFIILETDEKLFVKSNNIRIKKVKTTMLITA